MRTRIVIIALVAVALALGIAGSALAADSSNTMQAGPSTGQHVHGTIYYYSYNSSEWQVDYVKFVVNNGPASPSTSRAQMLCYSGSSLAGASGYKNCYRDSPMYWYPTNNVYLLKGKSHGTLQYYQTSGSFYQKVGSTF